MINAHFSDIAVSYARCKTECKRALNLPNIERIYALKYRLESIRKWSDTKTGKVTYVYCLLASLWKLYRYLLVQFNFENDKDAHEALGGLDVKSLREILKVAMRTLHGDYGLGCVQHSLNSKLCYYTNRPIIMVMLL